MYKKVTLMIWWTRDQRENGPKGGRDTTINGRPVTSSSRWPWAKESPNHPLRHTRNSDSPQLRNASSFLSLTLAFSPVFPRVLAPVPFSFNESLFCITWFSRLRHRHLVIFAIARFFTHSLLIQMNSSHKLCEIYITIFPSSLSLFLFLSTGIDWSK